MLLNILAMSVVLRGIVLLLFINFPGFEILTILGHVEFMPDESDINSEPIRDTQTHKDIPKKEGEEIVDKKELDNKDPDDDHDYIPKVNMNDHPDELLMEALEQDSESLRKELRRAENNDHVSHEGEQIRHGQGKSQRILKMDDGDIRKEQHEFIISKVKTELKTNYQKRVNPFLPKKVEQGEILKPKSKSWANEIVTSDGGLLFGQKHFKPTINNNQAKRKANDDKEDKDKNKDKNKDDKDDKDKDKSKDKDKNKNVKEKNSVDQASELKRIDSSEEDRRILNTPRFQDYRKHYIGKYLAEHYKDKLPSEKLVGQISDLITNELKEQWKIMIKNGEIDADGVPLQNNIQDIVRRYEHEQSQKKKKSLQAKESRKGYKINSPVSESKAERDRSTKSILGNMLRSPPSLSVNSKTRDNSIAASRSTMVHTNLQKASAIKPSQVRNIMMTKTQNPVNQGHQSSIKTPNTVNQGHQNSIKTPNPISQEHQSSIKTPNPVNEGHQSNIKTPNPVNQELQSNIKTLNPVNQGLQGSVQSGNHEKLKNEKTERLATGNKDDINGTIVNEDLKKKEMTFHNFTKVELLREKEVTGVMYKKGDPYEMSVVSNPDPKINELINIPMFNQIRKQQIDRYLDARYGNLPFTKDELKSADDLIIQKMIKDLQSENSRLLASLGHGKSELEKKERSHVEKVNDKSDSNLESGPKFEKKVEDKLDKSDEELKSSKEDKDVDSDFEMNGISDAIKFKRNSWKKVLSPTQQNVSQVDEEKAIDELYSEKKEEDEFRETKTTGNAINFRVAEDHHASIAEETEHKSEESIGLLDSIWGYFKGSSLNYDRDKEKSLEDLSQIDGEETEYDEKSNEISKDSEDAEPILAFSAEDDDPIETTVVNSPTKGTDAGLPQETSGDDTEVEQSKKSEEESKSREDVQASDSRDSFGSSEIVDERHEKLKYIKNYDEHMNEHMHEHIHKTSMSEEKEDIDSNPLQKLCKKYPSLGACQSFTAIPLLEEPVPKTQYSITFYIKYVTRFVNGIIYEIFFYSFGCLKSLMQILCNYTIGLFFSLIGKEQISQSMNNMFETISIQKFVGMIFVLINHIAFICYYKQSSMQPVIITNKDLDDLEEKQMKSLQNQVNVIKMKMTLEKEEKEKLQKKIEKETEIIELMLDKNKELKILLDENKIDKKQIKELEKSLRDHENRIKGKNVELDKLSLAIETAKTDHKTQQDSYKELEEKYRYVVIESELKDQSLYDLEENKKEMLKNSIIQEKQIVEKTNLLNEVSEKVGIMKVRQLDLQEKINSEQEVWKTMETKKKALQETLLSIDKLNYEGKLESGWHDAECFEDDDEVLNLMLDDEIKAERLQNIINAIKLKAEHLESVSKLTTCKTDLKNSSSVYHDFQDNLSNLSTQISTLSMEYKDLTKGVDKKDIELQTITKFFGDREAEYRKQSMSQKGELQKLSKDIESIDGEKRELSDLLKKIESLKEEIALNDKDYKQQIVILEEQSHNSYVKMRSALRECDENKLEKEVYRKRLFDIDISPKSVQQNVVSLPNNENESSESLGTNDKSHERLSDSANVAFSSDPSQPSVPPVHHPSVPPVHHPSVPPVHHPSVPPVHNPSVRPVHHPPMFDMFHGRGRFPANPLAAALYRVPPVGPYSMPLRPPFIPQVRPMRPIIQKNDARNNEKTLGAPNLSIAPSNSNTSSLNHLSNGITNVSIDASTMS